MSTGQAGTSGEYWFADAAAIGPDDREAYVAALVRLGAVDGMVDAEERIISAAASALGLDLEAEAAARRRARDRAVDTAVLVGNVRDDGLRVCLLRDAYRVAAADGHVSAAELEELGRLAAVLGVHPGASGPAPVPVRSHGPFGTVPRDVDGRPFPDASDLAACLHASPDVETLAARARGIAALGRELVEAGAAAAQVTRTVSALADAVSERAIELVLGAEDLGGIALCWLAFGSEGRSEQTLSTDQDNGIAFRSAPGMPVEEARARLVAAARRVNEALAACGYRRCKGNVMAGNPAWCLTVEEWCSRFASWVDEPTPEALLHATIFFDFRPVHGDPSLAEPLRDLLRRTVPGNRRFLAALTGMALERRPPLGLFRDFSVEGRGEHPGTVDLKCGAAALFQDAARIYALATGEGGPGTVERLRRAAAAAGVDPREVEGWVDAFHLVQVLRLRHQLEQERRGHEPHNHLDPYGLNPLERRFFRESLRQAAALQKRMARAFGGETPRI